MSYKFFQPLPNRLTPDYSNRTCILAYQFLEHAVNRNIHWRVDITVNSNEVTKILLYVLYQSRLIESWAQEIASAFHAILLEMSSDTKYIY